MQWCFNFPPLFSWFKEITDVAQVPHHRLPCIKERAGLSFICSRDLEFQGYPTFLWQNFSPRMMVFGNEVCSLVLKMFEVIDVLLEVGISHVHGTCIFHDGMHKGNICCAPTVYRTGMDVCVQEFQCLSSLLCDIHDVFVSLHVFRQEYT